LDLVLDKVKAVGAASKPASSGFFSFLSGSSGGPSSAQKNTIFLSLGYITAYATPNLVIARLDAHIFSTLEAHLKGVKEIAAKENVIKSMDLIGKALHPSHVQEDYVFKRRDEIFSLIITVCYCCQCGVGCKYCFQVLILDECIIAWLGLAWLGLT
jgi:maestro heat-like repeat-containing protein family member 1